MIEVDCRKCVNCTGEECVIFGKDANIAVKKCAYDGFKKYVVSKRKNKSAKEFSKELRNFDYFLELPKGSGT